MANASAIFFLELSSYEVAFAKFSSPVIIGATENLRSLQKLSIATVLTLIIQRTNIMMVPLIHRFLHTIRLSNLIFLSSNFTSRRRQTAILARILDAGFLIIAKDFLLTSLPLLFHRSVSNASLSLLPTAFLFLTRYRAIAEYFINFSFVGSNSVEHPELWRRSCDVLWGESRLIIRKI